MFHAHIIQLTKEVIDLSKIAWLSVESMRWLVSFNSLIISVYKGLEFKLDTIATLEARFPITCG